ncbi:MAG TPA: sigma-54 dependent transcriptional regulator [Candidatus Sulfotelmatobacter sp.]|nr:sigma-54 dependent transcriptional regulator [Candidatus Sulfotelmatobacter sp.]
MPLALIVEDDADALATLAELVELEGFEIARAASLREALQRLAERSPDVVITDLMLPDGSGLELLDHEYPAARPQIVLVTGNASKDSAIEAVRKGAKDYLEKSKDEGRLKVVLANVRRELADQREIRQLRGALREHGQFHQLIGASAAMQRVYDLIERVAPTQAAVLITGESGTGKELVALTVHELSPRREAEFVAVNCSAVPANLFESELFGHERGSFTGATQQHRGLFERASGGTLFLDEITEMPIELQPKLLRALESGEVTRIGAEQPLRVDVRVIAASNRPPEAAIRDGRLREDLFYRLNVFPIELPPLRDRGDDARLLAEHFLAEINRAEGSNKRLAAGIRERLTAHAWPGNVRELKNALHRAYILSRADVDLELSRPSIAGTPPAPGGDGAASAGIPVGLTLEEIERRMIVATLEHTGGDKREAARMLGISLKTLYNRLNVYAAAERGAPAAPPEAPGA